MVRFAWLLAAALLAAACDDDSTPTPDTTRPDGLLSDGGADGPGKTDGPGQTDGTPGDAQQPDAPKKPTGWYPVTGSGPAAAWHTATLLDDGKVLVVGGYVEDPDPKALTAAHLYDPKAGTFTGAGAMSTERYFHTATLLPDGRVLVVGGENETVDALATTEIFDPKQPAAQAWTAGPTLPGPRTRHAAVRLDDGKVLIAGGADFEAFPFVVLDSFAIFDATTNQLALPAAAMAQKRYRHGVCLLGTGTVLFAGGYDADYLDSMETYDPKTGNVVLLSAKLTYARTGPTLTLLQNKVLIVGGSSYSPGNDEIYDPATSSVKALNHPGSGPPAGHATVLLDDGRALVTGGVDANPSGGADHMTKAVAFDPAGGGMWVPQPDLKVGRTYHTATLLGDGSVLVVGGQFGKSDTYVDTAEIFWP